MDRGDGSTGVGRPETSPIYWGDGSTGGRRPESPNCTGEMVVQVYGICKVY